MKHMLKTIAKTVKSVKGNSLAEFATTTALMATLAATAAPKLSESAPNTSEFAIENVSSPLFLNAIIASEVGISI